jgi:hypothetical protein
MVIPIPYYPGVGEVTRIEIYLGLLTLAIFAFGLGLT